MRNFAYFHCYVEELWEGYERNGLIKQRFGIRCPHSIDMDEGLLFNSVLKKDGKLYNYIKEKRCGLYVDRLQGGGYIHPYDFDYGLIEEYRQMLGDDFLGFQMHEWLSNYKHDVGFKLEELAAEEWTEENITRMVREKYPFPHLFLESMTAKEHDLAGKPQDVYRFYKNMTETYRRRAEKLPLVPCDSYFLMYPFEAKNGAKVIMPEIGAQISDMRLQMCFARGVCGAYHIKLGAYYEPWGGEPFTVCSYHKNNRNEWGIKSSSDFPFEVGGVNGGSSRSLQWRAHLYAYLSGAEFISEEWGGYNTFTETETYQLSEYGLVKKRFLDFVEKYPDIGDKVAPIGAVISNRLPCFTLDGFGSGDICEMFGYPLDEELMKLNVAAKLGARRIFQNAVDMQGNEARVLINSNVPDAVDMLDEGDGSALKKYRFLIDMTGEDDFWQKHDNCISPDEVEEKLYELLPCHVDGGFHYLLNECEGGYYLSVFNHSGIVRTQKNGDEIMPSATKTAKITTKENGKLIPLEGNCGVCFDGQTYSVTLNGGDWLFAKIVTDARI